MRSRSISPSTSIISRSSDYSDSDDDSDDTSRYDDLTEAELNKIWERRNLAYYDRRQRKLAEAEEKERQQQQGLSGDEPFNSCSINSSSSSAHDHQGKDEVESSDPPSSSSVRDRQQPLARPEGFLCAAGCPEWRDFTSRNIMGDCNPERARRDPGYRSGWLSCERLVNMNRTRTGTTFANNFTPTNPRLAALLEHQRLEVARERCEEEAMRRQQQQQQQSRGFYAPSAAQQTAKYYRLNQAHRLQQQREFAAHAQEGGNSSPKSSSSGSNAGEEIHGQSNVQPPVITFYLALPNPTHHLSKPVRCDRCNLSMFTAVPATQFFCQSCGCVSSVPSQDAESESLWDDKMQDAEDLDCKMSSY